MTSPVVSIDPITDAILIGNFVAARDVQILARHGVRSIVSLDGSCKPTDATSLGVDRVLRYPLIDGSGNDGEMFRRAVRAVAKCVLSTPQVLVQCHAGRSRSVIVVACHLVAMGLAPTVEAALHWIAGRREICVTPALVVLARRLFEGAG